MDPNSQRPLGRTGASDYLRDQHGIKHSPDYLAKLAVTGGGPPFRKIKRTPVYTPDDLDEYAAEVTSPRVRSTSELRTRIAERDGEAA